MSDRESPSVNLDDKLQGNTLTIYWILLKQKEPISLRKIQRAANLSSPSLALHHLEKLKNLGLVEMERYGGYLVSKDVKTGFMRFFFNKGGFFLPRYAFYLIFFLSELICFLLLFDMKLSPIGLLLIITLVLAISFSVYETIFVWKAQPTSVSKL